MSKYLKNNLSEVEKYYEKIPEVKKWLDDIEQRMKYNYHELNKTMLAIDCWLKILKLEDYPICLYDVGNQADHSFRGGLLGYLHYGYIPYLYPPPTSYSRPSRIFDRFENGGAVKEIDVNIYRDEEVSINGTSFDVIDVKSHNEWIIGYPHFGEFILNRIEPIAHSDNLLEKESFIIHSVNPNYKVERFASEAELKEVEGNDIRRLKRISSGISEVINRLKEGSKRV